MKKLLLVFILVLSIGCAPATIQGLRDNPAGKLIFEVDQNYQKVYRIILNKARNQWQAGMITAQRVVQGDLYTDIESGNITVALHWVFGIDTYLTIDIKALPDTRTKVSTYYSLSTWKSGAELVEQWVKNGSTECRAD